MRVATRVTIVVAGCLVSACRSPADYRREADQVAYRIIEKKQQEALGRTEPFTIERPSDTLRRRLLIDQKLPRAAPASLGTRELEPIDQWPDPDYLKKPDAQNSMPPMAEAAPPLKLLLIDALQIGAHNSREYQTQKEQVFEAALRLDLERDRFRNTWFSLAETLISADLRGEDVVAGVESTRSFDLVRRFQAGTTFAAGLTVDLVRLLTMDRSSSLGIAADASISIPLLRGSGRFVVAEPLTQAERDVVYAIYDFERFKRTFAVRVASNFLAVLQQLDQLNNAKANYRRLIDGTRRARRLTDAGRLPQIQVDQSVQDELRARDRWIGAIATYERRLDSFRIQLGLPADSAVELDPEELPRLAKSVRQALNLPQVSHEPAQTPAGADTLEEQAPPGEPAPPPDSTSDEPIELAPPSRENAGPLELPEPRAIGLALENRLDMRVALGRIHDRQRTVAIAADALRADLTLLGAGSAGESRSLGSAGLSNAQLRPEKGDYSVLVSLDLALERTRERNTYRGSLIELERVVRDAQQLEDQIKFDMRDSLRSLLESREGLQISAQALKVARRRVDSSQMFLDAGRPGVQIRDVLEAEQALIDAQNNLTSALVQYRVTELEMQRDMGLLEVNEQGLWREYQPNGVNHDRQ